jgi:hypothetical protein
MGALTKQTTAELSAAEIATLSREMARGYLKLLKWYQTEMKVGVTEADTKARAIGDPEWARRALDQPPDQVSWAGLSALVEHYPEEGWAAWERIKADARDHLTSGHRAAEVLECGDGPWARAQFLAIRQGFREEWQPRGGIEDALVDQMAQAHSCYLSWMHRQHIQVSSEVRTQDAKLEGDGYWVPPRVDTAQAMDQAVAMADRFHRLFLRSLRALRDLRRYTPTLVVANAGQVNVTTGPQMNVAQSATCEQQAGG